MQCYNRELIPFFIKNNSSNLSKFKNLILRLYDLSEKKHKNNTIDFYRDELLNILILYHL